MIEDTPQLSADEYNDSHQETGIHKVMPEISFHAIAGTDHPQTIRVIGKLKNKHVTVLIDGGNTHNFID